MSGSNAEVREKDRLARLDVFTGGVGAIICSAFVISQRHAPPGMPQIPQSQILGMIFTCLLCPLAYFTSKPFYLKHRQFLVMLVRLAFAYGTVHDYGDIPQELVSWPRFFPSLLYHSRSLVMAWGCFGWQLVFPLHILVQAIHVLAASTILIPPLCSNTPPSFLLFNIPKFRLISKILDWPFAVVWPPAQVALTAATSNSAACISVVFWTQVVFGWMLPTIILSKALSRRGSRSRVVEIESPYVEWLPLLGFSQIIWCITRVAAMKYYQKF